MGCDIHLHQEVKINGKWEHAGNPRIDRNYRIFSKMAGVRRNPDYHEDPISEPKGLPSDVSTFTQFDCDRWGIDGHSHSYLTAEEISIFEDWFESISETFAGFVFGYLCGMGWGHHAKFPDERVEGVQDVRWIFWFDN